MYKMILNYMKEKPTIYTPSTDKFWDDEHISKQMLKCHLDPYSEPASRNHDFIKESVNWISDLVKSPQQMHLLDLGCGPGIYTDLFYDRGFTVTGIDFSERSINYAKAKAESEKKIKYIYQNYLEIDYKNEFDIITLIYCDFGVLNPNDRHTLLCKIKKALKPDGMLIMDAATDAQYASLTDNQTVEYCDGGFWSADPYICIKNYYHYENTHNHLDQYIIIESENCRCFNIWNQAFDKSTFEKELNNAGLKNIRFYDDVCGKPLSDGSKTICAVAKI